MSSVDVLAVLDDVLLVAQPHDVIEARAAVAELIAADQEYDAAIKAHKDLVRRIAEGGWLEIEVDALRQAGDRTVKAQMRRQDALDAVQGRAPDTGLPALNVDVAPPRAPGAGA